MTSPTRGTLQLDFDGTLAHEDVSTGILARFAGPEWTQRVNAASRELLTNPGSTALVDTMIEGFAALAGTHDDHLRYAREHHPARPGLADLIAAAEGLGLEPHVVSNGFEFYIRDYLRAAGVEGRVAIHSGAVGMDGRLAYAGPDGLPARGRFKLAWTRHFLAQHPLLVYAGDGSSDLAPARLATIVFARDSLLSGMPPDFAGTLRPFETLQDVAGGLRDLLSSGE